MTKTQTRYNTDDQDSIRAFFQQILSSSYATWDCPIGQGLHEMSLDEYQEPCIHGSVLHNSADPNSEGLLVVDDTARRIFNEVNRERAIVKHDTHTIDSALGEFWDIDYDTIDPWKIQYTEFGREKWLDMQPIWISQDESQRLISLLTEQSAR